MPPAPADAGLREDSYSQATGIWDLGWCHLICKISGCLICNSAIASPLLTPVHRSIHLFIPSLIYPVPSSHPMPGAGVRRKTVPSLKEFSGCNTQYPNPPLSQLQESVQSSSPANPPLARSGQQTVQETLQRRPSMGGGVGGDWGRLERNFCPVFWAGPTAHPFKGQMLQPDHEL